jgi:hypothetical protein
VGDKKAKPQPDQVDAAAAREIRRFLLGEKVLDLLKTPLWIASLWIPLQAVRPMIEDLAGKDTQVSGAMSISIGYAVVATAGWVNSNRKLRNLQRAEVNLSARMGRMGLDIKAEQTTREATE